MLPIQELLNRLHWDKAFATGDFAIGYYDRVEGKTIQVPLQQVHLAPGDHFSCQVTPTKTATLATSPCIASRKSARTAS